MIGGQIALVRPEGDRLLRAHHQRVGKAPHQHDDPEHHIHDTDRLVIDAGDPVAPQDTQPAIPGDQTEHGDAAERDADEGDDEDRLMQRQRGEAETAEDRAVGDGKRKAHDGTHKVWRSRWRARSAGAISPAPVIGCERLGAGGRWAESAAPWGMSIAWAIDCPAVCASFLIVSAMRSEEHTSELQSLMRISYAVFCLKKKKQQPIKTIKYTILPS